MDRSPEYAQMCRQAKEIQEQWKPQIGDFYEGLRVNVICTDELIEAITNDIKEHKADCWVTFLPHQDQLQAMVFKKTALSLACCFKDFIVRPMFDELMPNRKEQMAFMLKASMEQMWFCFVMHTLYKLRWNGSDWVPA